MTWANFVGNSRVVGVLQRMLSSGRVPPALLFAGQKGVGKFTLATLFARAANCEQKGKDSCGRCQSCQTLEAFDDLPGLRKAALDARGSANPEAVPLILRPHPNVTVLVPDGAFIRVSQMRYVVRQSYNVPTGGGRVVFLIDQAERLRFDFADVLLKVLEEPPDRTTLILVTSEPFQLRPTIRSRCIPVQFAPLSPGEIEAHLQHQRPKWKKTERELAAAVAAGSLATALTLDLDLYRQVRRSALELLQASLRGEFDPERLFAATAQLAGKGSAETRETEDSGSKREKFDFVLEVVYSLLSDVLYLKSGVPELRLRNPDIQGELERAAGSVEGERLNRLVKKLDQIEGWQRRNINRQLALDAVALAPTRVL